MVACPSSLPCPTPPCPSIMALREAELRKRECTLEKKEKKLKKKEERLRRQVKQFNKNRDAKLKLDLKASSKLDRARKRLQLAADAACRTDKTCPYKKPRCECKQKSCILGKIGECMHRSCHKREIGECKLHRSCLKREISECKLHRSCLKRELSECKLHRSCLKRELSECKLHRSCCKREIGGCKLHRSCLISKIGDCGQRCCVVRKIVTLLKKMYCCAESFICQKRRDCLDMYNQCFDPCGRKSCVGEEIPMNCFGYTKPSCVRPGFRPNWDAGECYSMANFMGRTPQPWSCQSWPVFYPSRNNGCSQLKNIGYFIALFAAFLFWTPCVLCLLLCFSCCSRAKA